jgi:DNA-binding NtrC family response regulator
MFLDEIGDMGPKMQAQLLRTLQDGEVRPVGGSEAIRVDVRIVCATNKDLDAEVKAGRFREDLYFRINVVTVHLPPLRDRGEDVPILVAHFLAKLARRERRAPAALSPEALKLLSNYAWPGNVRELENAIERAVAVAKGNVVLPADLPPEVGGGAGTGAAAAAAGGAGAGANEGGIIADRPTLAELERRYIQLVLTESAGNKKKAAEKLGIDRRTLYRALERGEDADEPDDDEQLRPPRHPKAPKAPEDTRACSSARRRHQGYGPGVSRSTASPWSSRPAHHRAARPWLQSTLLRSPSPRRARRGEVRVDGKAAVVPDRGAAPAHGLL